MTDYVCSSCIGENALKEYIETYADESYCNFCEESHANVHSISVDDLIEYMRRCASWEYDDAANWLPHETSEGGYQGATYDTYDLILDKLEIEFPKDKNDALLERVVSGFGDQLWCNDDPFGPSALQVAQFSWETFSRIVKHDRRYFFGAVKSEKYPSEELTPGELLAHILDYAQQIGLIQIIDELILYRARAWDNGRPWNNPKELGPPPANKALQPNRMSPAGIPMFYGSENLETAVLETASRTGTFSVGRFWTNRPIVLFDISDVPPIPSIFETDPESYALNPRNAIKFLRHISEEISKPINRDHRALIEYVPTQVVTEFIRTQQYDAAAIDGIKYKSAKSQGHFSYVLFATQENIFDQNNKSNSEAWLELKGINNVKATFTHKEINSIDMTK